MIRTRLWPFAVAVAFVAGCAGTGEVPTKDLEVGMQAPERASGYVEKHGRIARKFMVAAANPLAADAGYQVLKAGGSAVDAAIAVQMVLNLVEPQSSGIGGGAFLLHFDGKTVKAFDGRETAPATADDRLFQDAGGKPMPFYAGVVGGRSVGVPGVLRMLELAHREYGRLPWASLFAPAIGLAEEGFEISPRLASALKTEPHLKRDPVAAAYFYDASGNPWPAGHKLKNPALARTLHEIALGGADVFYKGSIARDIEAKVRNHPINPGGLTATDMAGYQAKVRAAVCIDYRAWVVCGMPPPSSGGIAVAQMLGILEQKSIGQYRPQAGVPDAEAIHLFSEAGRLAFADRARYVADTDFVPLPGNSVKPLLDKAYLAQRAAQIGERSMGQAQPGIPRGAKLARGSDAAPEFPSTSHISIVDMRGNALSMTTSIEDAFGSRQMVDGFLLNNQLTDFSFQSTDKDGPVANRVQPGKRPRSSMAPTLVFDAKTGKFMMSIGSPGGSSIINYVGKALIGTLDWGLDMQQAISLPNFGSRNGPTELEQGRIPSAVVQRLRLKGHEIREMELNSGLQGIMRMRSDGQDVWFGGADPRREGVVMGD